MKHIPPSTRKSARLIILSIGIFFFTGILVNLQAQAQLSFALAKSERLVKTQPDSAYLLLKDLVQHAREKKDPRTEGMCLHQIGQIFYNYGNYMQALDQLLQAEKIFRKQNASSQLAENLNLLGRVYYSNKQPELAATQFREALTINSRMQNVAGLAATYGNIGHLHEKKLRYDSAYYYQQKALGLYEQAADSMGMAKICENIGSIYEDAGKFDSAKYYFEYALTINHKFKDEISQIEILNNLGDVARKTGRYQEGLTYTRRALILANQKQSRYQLASACRDMARGFEFLQQFDSAYYYNELSRGMVEDIYSASNNQQIALLETIYQVDIKNSQIARYALDKKINAVVTGAVAIVILLLIILGWVTISRQRLKIRNEKESNARNQSFFETQRNLMQADLRNQQLEEEKLRSTLETRSKELSAHTLHLIQKNQLLEELRSNLHEIVADEKRDQRKQLKQLAQKINLNFSQDQHWEEFRVMFDQVHQKFFQNLQQHTDNLTPGELRMVALLRMKVTSADMATLLGISPDSLRVSRYRLKKKLRLGEGESLTSFLQSM